MSSEILIISSLYFFISELNSKKHPLTFFKYNNKWSLIDPYYGVYFLNDEDEFCKLYEHKLKKCFFYHLEFGKISENSINTIFFNKYFENLKELQDYYFFLINIFIKKCSNFLCKNHINTFVF